MTLARLPFGVKFGFLHVGPVEIFNSGRRALAVAKTPEFNMVQYEVWVEGTYEGSLLTLVSAGALTGGFFCKIAIKKPPVSCRCGYIRRLVNVRVRSTGKL